HLVARFRSHEFEPLDAGDDAHGKDALADLVPEVALASPGAEVVPRVRERAAPRVLEAARLARGRSTAFEGGIRSDARHVRVLGEPVFDARHRAASGGRGAGLRLQPATVRGADEGVRAAARVHPAFLLTGCGRRRGWDEVPIVVPDEVDAGEVAFHTGNGVRVGGADADAALEPTPCFRTLNSGFHVRVGDTPWLLRARLGAELRQGRGELVRAKVVARAVDAFVVDRYRSGDGAGIDDEGPQATLEPTTTIPVPVVVRDIGVRPAPRFLEARVPAEIRLVT